MTRAIIKRPQAERDIEESFVFIGENDSDSGLDFLLAVEQTLEFLALHPFVGSVRSFKDTELQNVRLWRVKTYDKHLIFYLVTEQAIEIIRVIHAARDYTKFFE